MRARLFVTEALRSITANLSTTIAAAMTVLIGMFLLGLFIALGSWVVSWTDHVKKEVLVKVFFEQDVKAKEVNAVRAQLDAMPEVAKIVYVSPREALAEQRKKYPDLYEELAFNPLPPAFEVTPSRAEDVNAIAGRLDPPPVGVEKIDYAQKKTERVLKVARIIEIVFLLAAAVLLAASIILIANTIRLSIFARRREIEVMKLVGATNWFVRGPFMLEGLICGLTGALIAVVLLFLGRELALPTIFSDTIKDAGADVRAWSFELIAAILIGAGLLLGALGSGITLRRFLRV
ncbi:MAG: ABC transporter permease [Thermoleophilia bacterium]|nr:ABC transporter permease [Thermoleophilia bacterium]